MVGIYFSGTGNSKYCIERFMKEYGTGIQIFSIEDEDALAHIKDSDEIVISYPVYFSNIPKILRDYVIRNGSLWQGKKIFVIATMGLFSGDGAGMLARLLQKYGAVITGGLHLQMPDCICDEKVLKHSPEKNVKLIQKTGRKICKAVRKIEQENPPQEGLGILSRMAGFFSQRLYFSQKPKNYTDKLKIDHEKCIGCGLCVSLCPMHNISHGKRYCRRERPVHHVLPLRQQMPPAGHHAAGKKSYRTVRYQPKFIVLCKPYLFFP